MFYALLDYVNISIFYRCNIGMRYLVSSFNTVRFEYDFKGRFLYDIFDD